MEQKPGFGRLSPAPVVPPGGRSYRGEEGGGAEWRRSTHPKASLGGAVPLRMRGAAGGDVPQASGPGPARRPQEGPAVSASHWGHGSEALRGRRGPRQAAPSPRPQAAGGAGGWVSAGGVRAEGLPLPVEKGLRPAGIRAFPPYPRITSVCALLPPAGTDGLRAMLAGGLPGGAGVRGRGWLDTCLLRSWSVNHWVGLCSLSPRQFRTAFDLLCRS